MSSIPGSQVVGVDLHLHRSVIARIDEFGNELGWVRIDNDPKALVAECRPRATGPWRCGASRQRGRRS